MPHSTDIDLTDKDIGGLASLDAIATFLTNLGYDTAARRPLTPESVGLDAGTVGAIKRIDLLAQDAEDGGPFLRVVFVQPASLTGRLRAGLVRALGKSTVDHVLILSPDFETIEFVLIDKPKSQIAKAAGIGLRSPVPRSFVVNRRLPTAANRRTLRRLTWTCQDAIDQFAKLKSVFQAAAFTSDHFQNRNLFADYYLEHRLRDDPAWRDNPSAAFAAATETLRDAEKRLIGKNKQVARERLYEPLFRKLGFTPAPVPAPPRAGKKGDEGDQPRLPDLELRDAGGRVLTTAFAYPWGRWLDGPDSDDADAPDENPGACVVSALDSGQAGWVVVTNGKQWRLYSRHAHARATHFYEVDLVEALADSAGTDPNEAFRYWWLFFRPAAFTAAHESCWLDQILQGSRDFAKKLGDNLKERIFLHVFKDLAAGFLADREKRLGQAGEPARDELDIVFEATLTLLYRLLFLLYAESRALLPVREAAYLSRSLRKIKDEIADQAGIALEAVPGKIERAYSATATGLYDRLAELFAAMDKGDAALNVPTYNGGLFNTAPGAGDRREERIAWFLKNHKIPDARLALAIDSLARDRDERTMGLVAVDFKSLEVRHLGSIYEGLLEFKLMVADEDKTTQAEKGQEKYIALSQAKAKRGQRAKVVVARGQVYLSNDKSERKASGSYYTPDPIVEYIVAQTVGPVLDEKLEALRPEFRKVRKTFDNELQKATNFPPPGLDRSDKAAIRRLAEQNTHAVHRGLVDRLFDLRVVDPAMGSGHFLVETVDFITDRLLKFLSAFPKNPVSFALDRTRSSILESLGAQGVTVDSDQLTDINLLKRHVLKRCIHGVDLNPMAVELAKVSLWLDAFTLGAPLSFLDHHLRCGNSLVGATIKQLEAATSQRLFKVDYEPLLRAINYVLLVSRLADATAAEVASSMATYDQARSALSGYRIVLDLLVAEHFGLPRAKGLVEHGGDLDLWDRERFLGSLAGEAERALVATVEALAIRPDRRFFHWELEFPEVFFGYVDAAERQIAHKDRIQPGTAGFDVVVGNPPYVRQESIKELKPFLKTTFQTYDSTNDLYVYFLEIEIGNLRAQGRMGMIVANKWMRACYGESLRGYLRRAAQPLEVIDFGHSPIFPDADTFPCILIVLKRPPPIIKRSPTLDDEQMVACHVPRERWSSNMDLIAYVNAARHLFPTNLLRDEGWSLEDPRVQTLMEKLRLSGITLKEFCRGGVYRGPGTGCNEAFFIDEATRARLIREDARSSELIRPLLRGRDAERWLPRRSGLYTIYSRRGIEIDNYPAVKRHLALFQERLEPRPGNWDNRDGNWPGRKPGQYKWYELQDSPSNESSAAMFSPKVVFQEMAWFNRFAMDKTGSVLNNTAYAVPLADAIVVAVLNSPLAWWYMWRTAQHGKDEVLRLIAAYMDTFPMPSGINDHLINEINPLVESLVKVMGKVLEHQEDIVNGCGKILSAPGVDRRVLYWMFLDDDAFSSRMFKQVGLKKTKGKLADDLGKFKEQSMRRLNELLTSQFDMERSLSTLVEAAYGLSPEESDLMHRTKPVRDPLDVIENKLRGQAPPEGEFLEDE